jgi:Rieske 2Fe-2S family protein
MCRIDRRSLREQSNLAEREAPPPAAQAGLQASLPRAAYCDQEFFERERRSIFFDQWFYAGRDEELAQPGAFRVLEIAGESVIVVRAESGRLHAHLNFCRHRGSRLLCG